MPTIEGLGAVSAVEPDALFPFQDGESNGAATPAQIVAAAGVTSGVSSVNGQAGDVSLDAGDVGATPDPDLLSGVSGATGDERIAVRLGSALVYLTAAQIAALVSVGAVTSVNGQAGVVSLDAGDVGASPDPELLSAVSGATGQEMIPARLGSALVFLTAAQIAALAAPSSGVTSVNGQSGAVSLDAGDIGATPDPALLALTSGLSGDERIAVMQGSAWIQIALSQLAMLSRKPVAVQIAVSDETTALTTGTAKTTFRMPFAMELLPGGAGARASLTTAQPSGSIFTVDINEGGSSILSTKLTIDNTEKTSTTAATPPVISDNVLADDAEITIDIDQIGTSGAAGLKVSLIGYPL